MFLLACVLCTFVILKTNSMCYNMQMPHSMGVSAYKDPKQKGYILAPQNGLLWLTALRFCIRCTGPCKTETGHFWSPSSRQETFEADCSHTDRVKDTSRLGAEGSELNKCA